MTRPVLNMSVTSCVNPIYSTQWLVFTDDAETWIEIGTAYDCGDTFDFVLYCKQPTCGFTQRWFAPSVGSHTYKITRENGNHVLYDLLIDGSVVQKVGLSPATTALWVATGLESYNDGKTVSAHNYSGLKRKRFDNNFDDWSGRDVKSVDKPIMCGSWNSDTSWRAGQNTSC